MESGKKKRRRFPRGLETVEAALLLPLVLLVTFGALKYGWLFLKSQQITHAAREMARVAVRPGDTAGLVDATFTELMEKANINGADYDLIPAGVGFPVTVRVFVPIGSVDILPLPWFDLDREREISTTVKMSKEGPWPAEP